MDNDTNITRGHLPFLIEEDGVLAAEPKGKGYTSRNILMHHNDASASADAWYHLKIPKINSDKNSHMFHINVRGYSYGTGVAIDLNFVGYGYHGRIINDKASRLRATAKQMRLGIYKASDGATVLKFKPSNTYYTTFTVDSMYVGNGLVLEAGDIELYVQVANL